MTKLLYNGEYIDLPDRAEIEYFDHDLSANEDENLENKENSEKVDSINLEDTIIDFNLNLEDTKELDLSDNYE